MVRKRTSRTWKVPEEQFRTIVAESFTQIDVVRKLGYQNAVANLNTVKRRIKELGLDTSHFTLKYRRPAVVARPLEELLVENSSYSRRNLKIRLIKTGMLELVCQLCGGGPTWNGAPLSLQIDHINGVHNDNRLENLRLLCPNCHSQTESFSGKKNRKPDSQNAKRRARAAIYASSKCRGEPTWRNQPRPGARKVVWPTKDELSQLVWKIPTMKISKQFGVSDKAVEKWCKRYKIQKPPRGYWTKQKYLPASSNG